MIEYHCMTSVIHLYVCMQNVLSLWSIYVIFHHYAKGLKLSWKLLSCNIFQFHCFINYYLLQLLNTCLIVYFFLLENSSELMLFVDCNEIKFLVSCMVSIYYRNSFVRWRIAWSVMVLIAENMVWPNFFLMNVFFALKGSQLFIIYW